MSWGYGIQDPGSKKGTPGPDPGVKKHRIPDLNEQHCIKALLF